ncbi:Alkaline phosphatase synthesis sensor protein PhoR [compost metagenome]
MVQDNGIGIPPEELTRIFEEYRQVALKGRARHPGAGLGLSIAKQLIEGLGGRITVQSRLGQGATFSVSLPLSADDEEGI